jgi:biotin carboxylase
MEKYLIILGAGPDQVPVFSEAKKLGLKTVAVDYNADSVAFEVADIEVIASVKDKEETISALKKLSARFAGVMTLGVEISPIVSAVAAEFRLTAVSEETAFLTTNKCARNIRLNRSKIPIPKFKIIEKRSDVSLSPPFVIKPSDSSASRGVRRIDKMDDLSGAFEIAKNFSSDGKVLIEELLEGPEISIEGFMLNGKMHVIGFADRNYSRNEEFYPLLMEDGSDSPSNLPEEIQNEAKDVFKRAALTLGIENGPSKGDLIVTKEGVKILEITSRLSGGGFCSRIVPLQSGVNIVNSTIKWACGLEVLDKEFQPKWNKYVAHRFFFHKPGKIRDIKGLDEIKRMPGIAYFVIQRPFKVGDILEPVNYANRLFYVVALSGDRKTAIKYAEDALSTIEIEYE